MQDLAIYELVDMEMRGTIVMPFQCHSCRCRLGMTLLRYRVHRVTFDSKIKK